MEFPGVPRGSKHLLLNTPCRESGGAGQVPSALPGGFLEFSKSVGIPSITPPRRGALCCRPGVWLVFFFFFLEKLFSLSRRLRMYFPPGMSLLAAAGGMCCPGLLNSGIPVALSIARICARTSCSLLGLCESFVLLPGCPGIVSHPILPFLG